MRLDWTEIAGGARLNILADGARLAYAKVPGSEQLSIHTKKIT